jgi:hypothetical protein
MTRRKRLSADLPQHWLHDPVFWQLTDRAWRLYTHALMWAIGRTDGEIPSQMLSSLLPGSDEDRDLAVKELVSARLWECTPDGWRIPNWVEHQSTIEQINNQRAYQARKKARQRAPERGN